MKAAQNAKGYWETTGNSRPPMTSDDLITTAMAINILRVYGRPAEKADTAQRLARAAEWLASAQAGTTQERAFRLLGLAWAGGPASAIEQAAQVLTGAQQPDGGWAQLPAMGTDAYATGEALYALHTGGGMAPGANVFRKGTQYLLRTQAQDGSWHVKTRALPFQPYFDSGFPYAKDQWISAAGTSWAAMALSFNEEPVKVRQRR